MTAATAPPDCAWLRSNPASIPSHTPKSFRKLLGADEHWRQLYKEWLVGTTDGVPNAPRVSTEIPAEELVRWFGQLVTAGDRADSDARPTTPLSELSPGEQAYARAHHGAPSNRDKLGVFANGYDAFVAEVDAVRAAFKAWVTKLQQPDAAGKKLTKKQAKDQAGKQLQRVSFANAARKQLEGMNRQTVLDINVGILLQLQIEKYKAATLPLIDSALKELDEVKWDETGKGYKTEALAGLRGSTTAVFTAAANLKSFTDNYARMEPGERANPANETTLFDLMIEFTEAVDLQGRAMTTAGRKVAAWAEWATRHKLSDNFATVYPRLAGGLLLLRTAVTAAQVTLNFFPPFNTIGIGLGLADDALEAGIKFLVTWRDSQDLEVQQKFAGKEYVIPWEKMNIAQKTVSGLSEAENKTWENIKKYTQDLPKTATKKVVKMGVNAVVEDAENRENTKDYVDLAGDLVDPHTGVAIANSAAGTSVATTIFGLTTKELAEVAPEAVPGLGAGWAVGGNLVDWIHFAAAQNKELRNQDGFTDEDIEKLRALMGNKETNPFHTAFAAGEMIVETTQPHAKLIFVRVARTRVKINLSVTPPVVHSVDEALVDQQIRSIVRESVRGPLPHKNLRYTVDRDNLTFVASTHPEYVITAPVTVTVGGQEFAGTAHLVYNMVAGGTTIDWVDGDIPANAIEVKLRTQENRRGQGRRDDKTLALTEADLREAFPQGTLVTFNDAEYKLYGRITDVSNRLEGNPVAGELEQRVVRFTTMGRDARGKPWELSLKYPHGGELEVLGGTEQTDPLDRMTGNDTVPLDPQALDGRFDGVVLHQEAGDRTYSVVLRNKVIKTVRDTGGAILVEVAATVPELAHKATTATVRVHDGELDLMVCEPSLLKLSFDRRAAHGALRPVKLLA